MEGTGEYLKRKLNILQKRVVKTCSNNNKLEKKSFIW